MFRTSGITALFLWALLFKGFISPSWGSEPVPMDSTATPAQQDSLIVVEQERPLWQSIIAWPFESVIQPSLNFLFLPIMPPMKYVARNRVLDRGVDLVTYGKQRTIMIYPTLNLLPGTQTNLGMTYRHWNLQGKDRDRFFIYVKKYINNDWDMRAFYRLKHLFGTDLYAWAQGEIKEDRDQAFWVDDFEDASFSYTDSSWKATTAVGNSLSEHWGWEIRFSVEHRIFGEPDLSLPLMPSDVESRAIFNRFERGMYQHFWQYPISLRLSFDDKDTPMAPTRGSALSVGWTYVPVSDYSDPMEKTVNWNNLNHDYMVFFTTYQKFFLIGKKRYALTRKESSDNQKYLSDFNLNEAKELFSPDQIRTTLLERKVIAFQFRMQQMYEVDEGGGAFTGYALSNAYTPLRGYSRGFFGKSLLATSVEYRWPLIKRVDGVVFNEYAMMGDHWASPEWDRLRNSWGFGIRVRKPSMFFFRFQVGFHGAQGVNFIITIRPEFR